MNRTLHKFLLSSLTFAACATSHAQALPENAYATLSFFDMQLAVRPLPGNSGASSISFPNSSGAHVMALVSDEPIAWARSDSSLRSGNAQATAVIGSAAASGLLLSEWLEGNVAASVQVLPRANGYSNGWADASLSASYSPTLTPFTEVTFFGHLRAELGGSLAGAGLAYSNVAVGIYLGSEEYWRFWNSRETIGVLDDEFSLTFRNDTAQAVSFDWLATGTVVAAVPEPNAALMLTLGLAAFGWRGRRRFDFWHTRLLRHQHGG